MQIKWEYPWESNTVSDQGLHCMFACIIFYKELNKNEKIPPFIP